MLLMALLVLAQPDPCSYLTPDQLAKEFVGVTFAQPKRTTATPAFSGQAPGTQCDYAGTQSYDVQLILYVDGSPAEAKTTFERLSAFYPSISKPSGIGDQAYIDKSHAIHVLKGKVRFYIAISHGADAKREEQDRALASSIAAKL